MRLFDAPATHYADLPVGPMGHGQFEYARTPDVFLRLDGWGPLTVCLDTNPLIYLLQNLDDVGGTFGLVGEALSPEVWDDPVAALRDLFTIWFWRDVRFYLPERQMADGKLTAERAASRRSALDAFAADFSYRGGFARATTTDDPYDVDSEDLRPLGDAGQARLWPPSLEQALPPGTDGELVRDALQAGCAAFLTEDGRVLKRGPALRGFGLAVLKPGGLLERLLAAGELAPERLYQPLIPDLQSFGHFFSVVPQDD